MSSPNRGGLNLDNFTSKPRLNGMVLTSPRSIEACRLNGVEPYELVPKSMESFASGNATQAMIQRRFDHAEQRREKILQKCRATRQELSQGTDDELPLSTPRQRSFEDSPARLSAKRNHESQQQRLERLEQERKQRNEEKLKALEEATRSALDNKFRQHDSIREKGAQRWEEVVDRHNYAADCDFERGSRRYETLLEKEQQRESAVFGTKAQRDATWQQKGAQRQGHREEVSNRSAEDLQRHNSQKREWLSDVERKQLLAEEHKESVKEQFQERGSENEKDRQTAQRRAAQRELERRTHHLTLHATKEERAEQAAAALEEQRAQKELEYQRREEDYLQTVARGGQLTEAQKQHAIDRLVRKEQTFEQSKAELVANKMEDLERKREQNMDHVEDITRTRKASEYKRQQQLRKHVLQCDHGVCTSPRGTRSQSGSVSSTPRY